MALFANEVRMYSLAIFLITVLAIYAYRLSKESKASYWVIFGITSLASLYTHYYSLMAAGIINVILFIYLIVNKKKKSYIIQIILGVLQGVLYLPWLIYFTSQLRVMSSNGFWISISFPKTLFEILGFQFSGKLNLYFGVVLAVLAYIYCIYILAKTKPKNNMPAIFAYAVYLLVIVAAWVMSKILGTDILYYRYTFVVTGLLFFVFSYLFSKGKDGFTIAFCVIVLISGIVNQVILVRQHYDSSNHQAIDYIAENIQEDDKIIVSDLGAGVVVSVNFWDNKQYFYNKADWGVGEAYKAFGKDFETVTTDDFINDCKTRTWVIAPADSSLYDTYFNNENYRLLASKNYKTKYEKYEFNFYLVEYVGE